MMCQLGGHVIAFRLVARADGLWVSGAGALATARHPVPDSGGDKPRQNREPLLPPGPGSWIRFLRRVPIKDPRYTGRCMVK